MSNPKTVNPVRWFEIYVQDMQRARKFYESVLQVKLERLETPKSMTTSPHHSTSTMELWSFPMSKEGPGSAGALVKLEGVPTGGGGTLVYFACEDCAVEAARAKSNGGAILREKFSIEPYGHIALVTDSEGNCIGLHSLT